MINEMIRLAVFAYAKEPSRLCRNVCQLALIRSLMKLIPEHSCAEGGGDAYIEHARLDGTSGYPLTILRSLALMIQVHYHGGGLGCGRFDHAWLNRTIGVACCCPEHLPACLSLAAVPTLAGTPLQTFRFKNPCFCFSEPDSHRETGPATPTREWVHGEFPRTSGCLQRLTLLRSPLLPLRSGSAVPLWSALPDG